MFDQNIVENPSRHRGYVETGEAIWLRPNSKTITVGEEIADNGLVRTPSKDTRKLFDVDDYMKKKKAFDEGKISDRYTRSLAGWTDEIKPKYQEWLEGGKKPQFAGMIEPTVFSAFKAIPRIIATFTQIQEESQLLDTIRVINIDDLNGVGIVDVGTVDEDIVQRQGTHTLPYEVNAPTVTQTTLEPLKYGWRVAFSTEFALVRFDYPQGYPNMESLVLNALGGKITKRRNEDIKKLINLTGNSGSQANWTTLNAGQTRYVNSAFDDIKEILNLVRGAGYGNAEFVGMHPDVWDAFYQNLSATQPAGLQPMVYEPYSYDNARRRTFGLFPNVEFVVDNSLTNNRIYAWRRDAIFHVFGGVRVVPFENREIGYTGQTVRTYFNSAKIKASLMVAGTGVLS